MMKKIHVSQIVVVEGKYDAIKLDSIIDGIIIPVNGFSVYKDSEKKELLKTLGREKGIILITDSDYAGFKIRNFIKQTLPKGKVKHAYIPAIKGREKRKNKPGKEGLLGVDGTVLATEGAVSEPVVRQMSEGVSRALNTDCAVATSGIAGPGGGTADKPVGTVWISATKRGRTESQCYHFAGNRDRVINHATTMAQIMLIKMLIN